MSAFLLALIPLTGCSGDVKRRWSEEVEVGGGKIIVIERYVRFTESMAMAGSAYSCFRIESLNYR
jgi:hypothetical protein